MAGKIKSDIIQGESQLTFNIGETTYITIGGASWNVAQPLNAQSTFVSTGAATFRGDATVTGNLTVSGATTYVNTSTLIVQDKNIEIANSASPSDTLADGAGITVKGDSDKTLTWANATKSFTFNQGLDIQRVIETVTANSTAINANTTIDVLSGSISNYTANVAANWTLNVRANATTRLDAVMGTNDSMTIAYLATQLGSNTFYQSAMQIDGTSVTPKYQGGSAPSAGNATSIDLYAFTIIKTAANTYTVLGSQTQYA